MSQIDIASILTEEAIQELIESTRVKAEEEYTKCAQIVAGATSYKGEVAAKATVRITFDDVKGFAFDVALEVVFPNLDKYDIMGNVEAEIVRMLFNEMLARNA